MTWHSFYLNDKAGRIAHAVDSFPYLAPLLLYPADKMPVCEARLENLRIAYETEASRPISLTSRPYHLVLDVCDICNLRCPLCVQATEPNGRPRRKMSLAVAKKSIAELSGGLLRVELFSWGEPFLNSELPDIIRTADQAQLFTRTSTHFSFRDWVDLADVVNSGLKWLVVSIDGVSQETYQQYRVGGHLDAVLSNVKELVRLKQSRGAIFPIVEWQFLAMKHNVDEIPLAHRLAEELQVDVFRYGGARGEMADRIRMTSRDNYERSQHVLLDGEHPLSEYRSDGERIHQHEKAGCRWLWGKLAIHADGGISPCWTSWDQKRDFGSVREQSLDSYWHSDVFATARAAATGTKGVSGPATLCETCAHSNAFVNAPERMLRWPSREDVGECAGILRDAGLQVAPVIQSRIESECTDQHRLLNATS